eukprot:CAMPEP_0198334832 /NCGR_PEP_ID=MMETSP1450-20131203/19885_1 /TAXON_ID=753684 ORGANISM="Madagascaria erythrocladiodes, Strain CCMP3234" /NCGR_SAMPLE_ID=MMETSP1450 /ASSEMBLY_ACC=CAM_ASM_001115 /LENGTH=66 /DNA_ID=CAMNT_0044039447 /DNA_START=615 /DNA_END=812 /DNA_ORIENTATION=-
MASASRALSPSRRSAAEGSKTSYGSASLKAGTTAGIICLFCSVVPRPPFCSAILLSSTLNAKRPAS